MDGRESGGGTAGAVSCPNCFALNPAEADFCEECGRPLGGTATLDPLKTIQTEGFMFRRMAAGGIPGWVLAVMWLVTLPCLLLLTRSILEGEIGFGEGLIPALVWGLTGMLLYRATSGYLRRRRKRPPS